jgi:hypothetical protein
VIDDERHLHRMARERVGVAEIAVLERAPHEIRQFAEHAVDVAKIGCAAVVARAADHVEQRLLARLQQHVAAAPRAFERDQAEHFAEDDLVAHDARRVAFDRHPRKQAVEARLGDLRDAAHERVRVIAAEQVFVDGALERRQVIGDVGRARDARAHRAARRATHPPRGAG